MQRRMQPASGASPFSYKRQDLPPCFGQKVLASKQVQQRSRQCSHHSQLQIQVRSPETVDSNLQNRRKSLNKALQCMRRFLVSSEFKCFLLFSLSCIRVLQPALFLLPFLLLLLTLLLLLFRFCVRSIGNLVLEDMEGDLNFRSDDQSNCDVPIEMQVKVKTPAVWMVAGIASTNLHCNVLQIQTPSDPRSCVPHPLKLEILLSLPLYLRKSQSAPLTGWRLPVLMFFCPATHHHSVLAKVDCIRKQQIQFGMKVYLPIAVNC